MQLDHRNGKNDDNRLENLRWLCPNCHSQTDTYCRGQGACSRVDIPADELLKMVESTPLGVVADRLGVSAEGIRRKLILAGLWQRQSGSSDLDGGFNP